MAALTLMGDNSEAQQAGSKKGPSPDDQYVLGPDSLPQAGVPKGQVTQHAWNDSKIYPYPDIVGKSPAKPIRVFQQDGANDLVNQFGSWPEANQAMAAALQEKGYDHKFVFGEGEHSAKHGTAIFPEVMRWMWRDFSK